MSNIDGLNPPIYGTPAPLWAMQFNTSFVAIDAHDHSPGNGVELSFDSINFINSFGCNFIESLNLVTFAGNVSTTNASVYSDGLELFTIDGFGRQIKITANGEVNVDLVTGGGFSGDYVPQNAQVTFATVSNTYTFAGTGGLIFSTVYCNNIGNFQSFVLPTTVNVEYLSVECPNIVGNFTPTATNTGNVITGNPINGNAIDLAPFLPLSSVNNISTYTTFFYTTVAPATHQYYSIFLPPNTAHYSVTTEHHTCVNSLQQVTNRNSASTSTRLTFDPARGTSISPKYVTTYGGVSQSAPLFSVAIGPGTPPNTEIFANWVYSDNLVLESQDPSFVWNNDLVLALKATQ
jgi:hypothetical protein